MGFSCQNLSFFHSFLYSANKKSKIFYNNYDIRALIIYFCFALIDLINDYKNIFSRDNNVCLEVFVVVFMCIITFKKIIFSMKRGDKTAPDLSV